MPIEIKAADSFDSMMADLKASTDAAAARMTPKQAALKAGDCVLGIDGELVWFAEILETPSDYEPTISENADDCRPARLFFDKGEDGEATDIHVSRALLKIDRKTFAAVCEQGPEAALNVTSPNTGKKVITPAIYFGAEALV